MCGRFSVINEHLSDRVSELLGISYSTTTNTDLCPSQFVSAIAADGNSYQQGELSWGIKPEWAKRLLINAQAETAAQKATFKQAYATNRCLVPMTGWYEWRTNTASNKKEKFFFSHAGEQPLFMAALWFAGQPNQLVTLTIKPNELCALYHKRMPLLILPEHIDYWLRGSPAQLEPLIGAVDDQLIRVEAA
ncbi:SOS response-associated peptidase family protein [Thalassomonas viridans]|uniref:Abasic site processing protein n=1 Tax=Thalassomonas viridans TaxID=137584 RepID=A0AAF0C8X9_9GAMM|nr:SOS response-associated peptidase family protein [Thalassomonas viridans]WDE04319.1 SOS response-associated peptidase family protein [Thalassomonas viridans]